MRRIYILLLLISHFTTAIQASDLPNIKYNFSYLTEDIGLSHNYVDDIYKDSNGFIWFATHNGLSRYDGYNFLNFNSTTNPINLKGDLVYHICEDNYKRLWVTTERGVDIIDLEKYCTISLPIDLYSPLWNMMNANATYIYKDKQGSIWVSAANSLYCIDFSDTGDIKDYYELEKGISASSIHAIADLGWGICAGVNNSLMSVERHNEHTLKVKNISQLVSERYSDWKIQALVVDEDIIWIGSNYGLYSYNHYNQELKEYKRLNTLSPSSSQLHITAIKQNDDGLLFIGTLHGLIVFNKTNDDFQLIQQDLSPLNQSLNSNFVNCIFPDKNELWVGTEIGGVNYLSAPKIICKVWRAENGNSSSLSAHPVSAISEDKEGNLWVGTIEGGLNLKRKGQEKFEHFKNNQADPKSIAHNSVSGILIDRENNLWAYTWGMGISKLNLNIPNNRSFERYYRGATPGLENNFVSSACEDTINKGIWFATTEGLHFYDKRKEVFQPIHFNVIDNNFDTMNALHIDSKYRLWVGTSRGVFIINLFSFARSRRHFDYKHITTNLADPKSQKTDKINTIFEDSEGIIWLGCNGSGLYKLTDDKGGNYRFVNYTMKDGLPNDNIIGILEDKAGCLWFSTNQGVSQLNKSSMLFSNYNKYDGLQTNQFYRNAYYSEQDNLLYFGNTYGLIAISPETPSVETKNSKVLITKLSISGETIYPSSGKYIESSISNTNTIHLHEKHRSIALSFSSCNYDYTKQMRFAYQLKGYEKNWNELKAGENVAQYTYIPAGDYTLQVRTTDNQGVWLKEFSSVHISVEPYFYNSWWFYLLSILLILFLIQRFYIWKVNSYRHQQEILENTVKERTAALSVQNKQLIKMSRKIAETTEEKIAFFTNITHEFRTPVTLINGPLEVALKRSKDPLVTEQIELAERSSKYLLALVNELMDFRKIDSQKVTLNKKEDNILSFLESVLMPLAAFAKERQISITTYSRLENENLVLDYEYIRKVIINLVSNAIKFTPNNGKIEIYAASIENERSQKMIYLGVRDNGSGIASDELEKIFDRFYQSKKSTKYHVQGQSGTGIGLYLCDKIIRLHGGTIKAYNNKSKGSTIRVMLPYSEAKQRIESNNKNASIDNTDEREVELKVVNLIANDEKKPSRHETILVVDDNPDMRSYIRTLLQTNYKIIEAGDGTEALEILRRRKVDLILSDLMMPVMNGIELSKSVKSDLSISHIPFIMLTAVVAEEQKKESFQIGVDYYLCKPFDEEILFYLIRNIFEQQKKYRSQFAVNMKESALSIAEESKDSKFISYAIEQMKLHYSDSNYELDQFVRDMGYSKTLVNKKLQDLTGQSIGQFMKNYRLKVAYEIITTKSQNKDNNISEIAYSVGFNDPKYFTKCFKEAYKVLPSTLLTK